MQRLDSKTNTIDPGSSTAAVILELLRHARSENTTIGITKMMKLLYYVDFLSVRESGRPVTPGVYRKLPYGPVQKAAFTVIEQLEEDGCLVIQKRKISGGRTMEELSLPEGVNIDCGVHLTMEQKDHIRAVYDRYSKLTTKEIVEQSHKEAPWVLTEMGEIVHYTLAKFLDPL